MADFETFDGGLPAPIETLETILQKAGTNVIEVAFEYSFFVHPKAVRQRTPYFPDFARYSREHYPGKSKGQYAEWQGRRVKMDDNSRAQMAWGKYTGRPVLRKSGYGVRHIWGNPWDPDAFTAGWNLCYMPFWVGMLTEKQHPHPELPRAIQQASWDLFFAKDPVCEPPSFVRDPEFDLQAALRGKFIRVLSGSNPEAGAPRFSGTGEEKVRAIRSASNQSWKNLRKGVRALLGEPHESFGTENVAASSKSVVRRMRRETGMSLQRLKDVLDSM